MTSKRESLETWLGITAIESLGVAVRGNRGRCDRKMRDSVQNHAIQMIAHTHTRNKPDFIIVVQPEAVMMDRDVAE
jgi:hypothetical protein